ncbi:hypothetical protein WJX74_008220 [Apatococcus lobatus]|uniref:Uncharacterized protein n=1 Tax=Apatococcus lobatus TaxID=904363 RepID=A0AAW1RQF4_9CHLO
MQDASDAAMVPIDTKDIPGVIPAAAREALRYQLLAAARQTVLQSVQLMGQASEAVARMAASAGRNQAVRQTAPPKASSSIVVQLRLLNGQVITQPMASDQGLRSLQQTVALQTKVPPSRQSLVLVEERNRSPTLQTFSRYLARQLKHSRQDTQGFIMGWANFLIFPEAFAREFSGRGLLGWAKATLQLRLMELQREKTGKAILLVEPMGGQVISVGADPLQPLSDVQQLIEQQTHIMVEQQSLLILEKPVPGVNGYALDQLLLLWLEATKRLTQSLTKARALWLQYYPWSRGIKIDVATQEGNNISMIVTQAKTVGTIQEMLGQGQAAPLNLTPSRPLSSLVFTGPRQCLPQ